MTEIIVTPNKFANVNGTEIYYELSGSGPPLILVHGGGMTSQMWKTQVGPLSAHFKVITFDLRGHGESKTGEGPLSFIDDLQAFMTYLDLESASLMGLSFGGCIVRSFAILYPSRVEALILASTGGWGLEDIETTKDENERWAKPYQAASDGNYELAVELTIDEWVNGVDYSASPEVRRRAKKMLAENLPSFTNLPPDDWPAHQKIEHLANILAPTLIVLGRHDQDISHRTGKAMAAQIPDSKTVVLEDGAHHINMDRPVAYNQAVLDFLNQNFEGKNKQNKIGSLKEKTR